METVVRDFIVTLMLAEAVQVDGFALLALFPKEASTLAYIALQTAIEAHSVKVREVSTSGTVGDILVSTLGSSPVLALDGEELAGAKQNRILNTTVLLEGGKDTVIPVSCTEHGRWSYTSDEFQASSSFAPPRVRENAKRAVNQALTENRGFRADQGEVWCNVSRLASDAGIDSPTGAMNDVVKSRLPELERMMAALPARAGQCGLLAIAHERVLGFDVVSRPAVYAHLHERLLRSYLLEPAAAATPSTSADSTAEARQFLQAAMHAEERRYQSVGLGEDYRYSGDTIVGSALSHEGQLVHAAFFRVPPQEKARGEPGLQGYRTRMGFRAGMPFPGGSNTIID
ncbi:MAG: hypothetical protein E4G93_02880 [Dehalococcoidia bacterium]|nr:MAG: hypothetical protein E4G93_02880 [Dehalococcoidia bacterium]